MYAFLRERGIGGVASNCAHGRTTYRRSFTYMITPVTRCPIFEQTRGWCWPGLDTLLYSLGVSCLRLTIYGVALEVDCVGDLDAVLHYRNHGLTIPYQDNTRSNIGDGERIGRASPIPRVAADHISDLNRSPSGVVVNT